MNGLPFSITRYLCGQWTERTIFIYILINKQGYITDWSDNITPFYGLKLNTQQAADEQIVFLQGCLPYDSCEPLILDSVNFDTGRSADIHLIPAEEEELCVLLFDVTESTKLRQQLQQKSNDIALLYEQEKHSIRKLKQSYKQLERQKEISETANRAKTTFLQHINHDLKNPLNGILGFLQLLEMHDENPLDKDQQEYLQEIKNSSTYMLDLVNELLDIAKIESGRISINSELLTPATIVYDSINILKPIAEKNNITFINRINLNIPPIYTDPVRFRQIMINFLSNGIKYNNPDGCIIISSYITRQSKLRINIKDTGIGIKNDHLDKVFEAFERGDAEKTNIEGTGIGLNVCQQLAELMQGSVGVYSDLGCGSLFWIELPLEQKIINSASLENTQQTALYIDAEKISIDLTRDLINECSEYNVFAVKNVEKALESVEKQSISVIIIHTNSFKNDYLQILAQLQAHPIAKKIPVVAIFDTNTEAMEITAAMQAGFYDYISQPFDFTLTLELFERLKSIQE